MSKKIRSAYVITFSAGDIELGLDALNDLLCMLTLDEDLADPKAASSWLHGLEMTLWAAKRRRRTVGVAQF